MKSFMGKHSALGTLLLISFLLVPSQSKADLEGAYESQGDLKEYLHKTCKELGEQSYVYAEIPSSSGDLIIALNGKKYIVDRSYPAYGSKDCVFLIWGIIPMDTAWGLARASIQIF